MLKLSISFSGLFSYSKWDLFLCWNIKFFFSRKCRRKFFELALIKWFFFRFILVFDYQDNLEYRSSFKMKLEQNIIIIITANFFFQFFCEFERNHWWVIEMSELRRRWNRDGKIDWIVIRVRFRFFIRVECLFFNRIEKCDFFVFFFSSIFI